MISQLTGTLLEKQPNHCIIDVGGVGYGVHVSLSTYGALPEPGGRVTLPIHTYVREDQLVLFGFATAEERTLFLKLISISGVGPKTAMGILSGLPPAELVEAISRGDAAKLSTVPGVGKKTAERMIVELKDSLAREVQLLRASASSSFPAVRDDALSALINLGYARPVADAALNKAGCSDEMSVEAAIRAALKELCRT